MSFTERKTADVLDEAAWEAAVARIEAQAERMHQWHVRHRGQPWTDCPTWDCRHWVDVTRQLRRDAHDIRGSIADLRRSLDKEAGFCEYMHRVGSDALGDG